MLVLVVEVGIRAYWSLKINTFLEGDSVRGIVTRKIITWRGLLPRLKVEYSYRGNLYQASSYVSDRLHFSTRIGDRIAIRVCPIIPSIWVCDAGATQE
jgi:hypothetical protein